MEGWPVWGARPVSGLLALEARPLGSSNAPSPSFVPDSAPERIIIVVVVVVVVEPVPTILLSPLLLLFTAVEDVGVMGVMEVAVVVSVGEKGSEITPTSPCIDDAPPLASKSRLVVAIAVAIVVVVVVAVVGIVVVVVVEAEVGRKYCIIFCTEDSPGPVCGAVWELGLGLRLGLGLGPVEREERPSPCPFGEVLVPVSSST